jgi:hypothetical protein
MSLPKQYQHRNTTAAMLMLQHYCHNTIAAVLLPQHCPTEVIILWEWHNNNNTTKTIPPLQCHGYNTTGTMLLCFNIAMVLTWHHHCHNKITLMPPQAAPPPNYILPNTTAATLQAKHSQHENKATATLPLMQCHYFKSIVNCKNMTASYHNICFPWT